MKKRLEWKVGLFVLIGFVLLAVLMLGFSKGLTLFRPTYTILLRSTDVGSLKVRSAVNMSGVQVGTVSDIRLAPDGRSVTLTLKIYNEFPIHRDARFTIEQSNLLGDEYVAITPTKNAAPVFRNGGIAHAEAPFNFTETARTAAGLVVRVGQTAQQLTETVADLRRVLLNDQTLTNLAITAQNLRDTSERATTTLNGLNSAVDEINSLLLTNGPSVSLVASNLSLFSQDLKTAGSTLNNLLVTNAPEVNAAIKNIETSSETLRSLLKNLEEGKGAAGKLLRDEQLSANLSQVAQNLSVTSSNLNRLGLWGILWKKKEPRRTPPPQPLPAPKYEQR